MKIDARAAFVMAVLLLGAAPSIAQKDDRPLIRLTNQATTPVMVFGRCGPKPVAEKNLAGWLVLNGARFRNSEYPDLGKHILEIYAAQQQSSNSNAEFTQLPVAESEADPHGHIIKGWAICPTERFAETRSANWRSLIWMPRYSSAFNHRIALHVGSNCRKRGTLENYEAPFGVQA
jgi:hypothetical protein